MDTLRLSPVVWGSAKDCGLPGNSDWALSATPATEQLGAWFL